MNEHDNLTPAEMELYRSALNEAYPALKSDIHGNVMKAIRAERILQKKRARRAAFVKWGSAAACLAIVCLVGWRMIPGTDKFAPEADNRAEAFIFKTDDVAACNADNVVVQTYQFAAEIDGEKVYGDLTTTSSSTGANAGKAGTPEAPEAPADPGTCTEECETEETEEPEETEIPEN